MSAQEIKQLKAQNFMKNIKFFTAYSSEILDTYFEDEKRLIQIRYRSDQLQTRPVLIELLHSFAKCHEYSLATLHLGKIMKLNFTSSGRLESWSTLFFCSF